MKSELHHLKSWHEGNPSKDEYISLLESALAYEVEHRDDDRRISSDPPETGETVANEFEAALDWAISSAVTHPNFSVPSAEWKQHLRVIKG